MSHFPPPGEPAGLPAPRLHCAPVEDPPADFVTLRLLLQPGGLSIEMNRPNMLVGRHSEADVRLALPDVSRRHCRFVFAAGTWQVFDLNSLNGTFVNDVRLDEAALAHGDRVRIGGLTFLVQIASPVSQAPADEESRDGVLRSIADILPGPGHDQRKAS